MSAQEAQGRSDDASAGPTERSAGPEQIFYDGSCGLCHFTVRFVSRWDKSGRAFRFAPLNGPTFSARVVSEEPVALPDSVIVATRDGRLLCRSQAVVHILEQLGGTFGFLGRVLACVPRPIGDLGYRTVARLRRWVFRRPEASCPLVSPAVARRFDP